MWDDILDCDVDEIRRVKEFGLSTHFYPIRSTTQSNKHHPSKSNHQNSPTKIMSKFTIDKFIHRISTTKSCQKSCQNPLTKIHLPKISNQFILINFQQHPPAEVNFHFLLQVFPRAMSYNTSRFAKKLNRNDNDNHSHLQSK